MVAVFVSSRCFISSLSLLACSFYFSLMQEYQSSSSSGPNASLLRLTWFKSTNTHTPICTHTNLFRSIAAEWTASNIWDPPPADLRGIFIMSWNIQGQKWREILGWLVIQLQTDPLLYCKQRPILLSSFVLTLLCSQFAQLKSINVRHLRQGCA